MIGVFTHFAASCTGGGDFLFFPKWYKYLNLQEIVANGKVLGCNPQINQLSDVWLILAAVIELLLRVAALAAVAYVVVAGFQYNTSGGDPGKTAAAQKTLTNALTGLVISVSAAAFVTYIAGRFK